MSLLKHIKCYKICLTFWCFCWSKKKLGGGGWFSLLFNSIFKITKINCLLCKTLKFFQNKKFSISCTYISLRERTAVFMLQSFLYTAKQWQLIQLTNLYNSNTIAFSLLTVPNSLYLPFTILFTIFIYIYCSWIFFLKVYQKLRILKVRAIWNALILIFLDVFSLQNSTSDVTASTYYRGPWNPNCGPSSGAATTATTGRWSTRDAPWVSVSVCLSTGRLSVSEQESIFIVLPVMLFQHL